MDVAGVPEIVGGRLLLGGAMTWTSNAGSNVCNLPSETHTTMPRCMPTSAAPGVPDNEPVDVLKVAQVGFASIPKSSASPSASAAEGVNEYEDPWLTLVAGVPEIVGALLPALTAAASSSSPPHAASEIPSATMTDPRNSCRVSPMPESPQEIPGGHMATLVPC